MDVPRITGTSSIELNATTGDAARFRAELQQPGSGSRSSAASPVAAAIPADLVELAQTSAIPYDLLSQVFQTLGQALDSGSLKNAQSAYWTLQQIIAGAPSLADQTSPNRRLLLLAEAFAHLRQAVQSGDLPGAQQAYQTMRMLMQNAPPTADRLLENAKVQVSPDAITDRPDRSSRTDNSLSAQQAYRAIQQELQNEAGVSQFADTARTAAFSPDAYSLYLLIAANQFAAQSGGQERGLSPRLGPRLAIGLWWGGINLAILCLAAVTGVLEMRLPSLIPVLLAMLAINTLIWLGARAFSNRS
jgi:hypothetical protein